MTTDPTAHETHEQAHFALQQVSSIPRTDNEPVFNAPWEAEVFALCLSLHQQGLFTWNEWANELATTITSAQQTGDPDLGDTYYQHWLATLEHIVIAKKVGSADNLNDLCQAWDAAARSTPHGAPITLPGE